MKTCAKPVIRNAKISPNDATIKFNGNYTITCDEGYIESGGTIMKCTDSDKFDKNISCTGKL